MYGCDSVVRARGGHKPEDPKRGRTYHVKIKPHRSSMKPKRHRQTPGIRRIIR